MLVLMGLGFLGGIFMCFLLLRGLIELFRDGSFADNGGAIMVFTILLPVYAYMTFYLLSGLLKAFGE